METILEITEISNKIRKFSGEDRQINLKDILEFFKENYKIRNIYNTLVIDKKIKKSIEEEKIKKIY
jgi:hypothetical protein